ncbi:24968_t:CDS:2, partial [Racocetra persica]
DKHLTLKISDFGLSTTKEALGLGDMAGGTPKWRAPERFAYNPKLYQKFIENPEFSKLLKNEELANHYKNRPQHSVKMREDINDLVGILEQKDTPGKIKHVIKKCCEFDPIKRISFEEVVIELQN